MKPVKFTTEDSISVIENTLKQSLSQKTGASNYYIIWGTVIFLYFMGYYITFQFQNETSKSIANSLSTLFAVGGVLSFLQSRKDDKKETSVPLNEKIYTYAWIGASIGLATLVMGNLSHFLELFCTGIVLIFGLVNFIIGGITKFTPLIIGGAISMLLTVLIPNVSIEYKFLVSAIGVLSSCLIPGLFMKKTTANV